MGQVGRIQGYPPEIMALLNTAVSFLGVLFAGSFTIPEITNMLSGDGVRYALGLPTCAYGLIFYILILVLSLRYLRDSRNQTQ